MKRLWWYQNKYQHIWQYDYYCFSTSFESSLALKKNLTWNYGTNMHILFILLVRISYEKESLDVLLLN